MGGSESKHVSLANPTGVEIPMSFDIFYKKSLNVKLYLGREKGDKLYAAHMPSGWWGDIVMFNGPDSDSGELARVKDSGRLGGDCTMIMPPLNHGSQPVMEEMRVQGSLTKDFYVFPCMVGTGDKAHPEKFEWHRASKAEVKEALGKKKWSAEGWKLIRPSNGGEVIAVCSSDYVIGSSSTGKFTFLGSAAQGDMGDLCYLMVTLSFLRLWQRYMRNIMQASIAAGAA